MHLSRSVVSPSAVVAEWLRRWTRNPMGVTRAGSNPASCVIFFFKHEKTKSRIWYEKKEKILVCFY